jgi:hypothetical protein
MANFTTLVVVHKATGTLYYANAMYCTRAGDTPANTLFHERIRDCDYERAITFPWWSRTGGAAPVRYIDLINTDAAFDSMLFDDWRDTRVDIYLVLPRAAFSTATLVGTLFVENVVTPDPNTFRLNGYSIVEALDKELTTKYDPKITNAQYRNKPRPISLGRIRFVYPINRTVGDTTTSTRAVYDVADDYFEKLEGVFIRGANITEVQTNLPLANQFFTQQDFDPEYGGIGFRTRLVEYRIAADVQGQLRREAEITTNSTFPTGSGSTITGWTVTPGSGTISWLGAGQAYISSIGVDDVYISQSLTLVDGQYYQLQAEIFSGTGVWTMSQGTTALRSVEVFTGAHHTVFQFSTGEATDIRIGFLTGASGNITLSAFRCFPVFRINNLSEVMRFVADRAGVTTASLDLASASSIEEANEVKIAFAATDEVKGGELLRKAAASYGCALYQASTGLLTPIKLAEPLPDTEEDFILYEVDVDGEVQFEPDFAPGLSKRLNYNRNYNVHSEDDVQGITATTSAGVALRAEFMRDVNTTESTVTLHSLYDDAEERDPLESLITTKADADVLINEICGLYTVVRGFYSFRAFVTTVEPHTIEPGQTVKLYYSRYGLEVGKNLLVVYAKSSFGAKSVDLVLWG